VQGRFISPPGDAAANRGRIREQNLLDQS